MKKQLAREWLWLVRCYLLTVVLIVGRARVTELDSTESLIVSGLAYSVLFGPALYLVISAVRLTIWAHRVVTRAD